MALNIAQSEAPGVKSGHDVIKSRCPLYPQKRRFLGAVSMSALCQKRTLAGVVADNKRPLEGMSSYRKAPQAGADHGDGGTIIGVEKAERLEAARDKIGQRLAKFLVSRDSRTSNDVGLSATAALIILRQD
jgi:hypothetical protein